MDMAALAVAATTVIGSFIGSVRWLVKHYLAELKTNGGSSMRDELNELRVHHRQQELLLRCLWQLPYSMCAGMPLKQIVQCVAPRLNASDLLSVMMSSP